MTERGVIGDADYIELFGGLQGRLTAKTTLHVRGGHQRREFEDAIETIEDWVAAAGLSGRVSERTDWNLDLSRMERVSVRIRVGAASPGRGVDAATNRSNALT